MVHHPVSNENLLSYWREDPLFNEHHEHWHIVYPYEGQVDKTRLTEEDLDKIVSGEREATFRLWKDRHGELFAYMHSQLLARYAAERLSAGLPPVVPFGDYQQPIEESYDPGNIKIKQANNEEWKPANRPANVSLGNLTISPFAARPGAALSKQEAFRDRLLAAIDDGKAGTARLGISELGERIEATERTQSPYYGALHNDGHLHFSLYDNDAARRGPMFWEATAVRDPVFYRWHAHIDSFFRRYQNALGPEDFKDLPPVEANRFVVVGSSSKENELTTEMRARTLRAGTVQQSERSEVIQQDEAAIKYLSHEDFYYKIEITNTTSQPIPVTVRIFMVPEETLNKREAWIEMDKFRHIVPRAGIRTIVTRKSISSSVVRHPVWTAEMLEGKVAWPDESGQNPGCRCGWPYTLLLPRGTPEGMKFRFVAIMTPGDDIDSNHLDRENSSSYCGVLDSTYPDKRPMGYPFERPLRTSIADFLSDENRLPQVISTIVIIKHRDQTGGGSSLAKVNP